MSESDIEKEIKARVEFKLNELLTAVGNIAQRNWLAALHGRGQRYLDYSDAFKQLKLLMEKEIKMPVPYDNMAEIKRREKRDRIVTKLSDRLLFRGERDYHQKEKFIVGVVEEILE